MDEWVKRNKVGIFLTIVVVFLLGVVVLQVLAASFRHYNGSEPEMTEVHNVNTAVTALIADPGRFVDSLDEFPTNSFVECNPEGGSCTRDMNLLAMINSGSSGKYGINEGSCAADYMITEKTKWWYCTDIKGHVTGYLKETCLPEDDMLRH